ncbi:hypothetical protein [Cytobacillus gottheilii]|uniref:hypothetical protein n=1 Tax=Cytobacillus gottheilii TaxID=859144 RepID=UPI0009BBFECF|nr:hypothetical protein [Cytobacillus gottheilii]
MTEENKNENGGNGGGNLLASLAQFLFDSKSEIKKVWNLVQRRKLRKYYFLLSDIGRIYEGMEDSKSKGEFNFDLTSQNKVVIAEILDEISNDSSLNKDVNFKRNLELIKVDLEKLERLKGIAAIPTLKRISLSRIKVMKSLLDLMDDSEFTKGLGESNKKEYEMTISKVRANLDLEETAIRENH